MDTQGEIVPNVRRIAVLRANAIGDFVFTLPALESLRVAYPNAEITLIGQEWHRTFLAGRPGPVDRVLVAPHSLQENRHPQTETEREELEDFFRRQAGEPFDIALQMHGGGAHSNPFILRLNARLRAGMKSPHAPPLDRWMPYVYYQNETLRMLEVVSLVGVRPATVEPRLAVTGQDIEESCQVVPETEKPIAFIHPGAGDPRRRWPAEHFARVSDALAEKGFYIVVNGTGKDGSATRRVIEQMRLPAQSIYESLSLNGLAGLLERSAIVISNDSGPLHMAVSVGAPTVGLYWCGNLVNASPATRMRHRPIISWRLNCPVCGTNYGVSHCEHTESLMEIPVEEVLAAAQDLLN